MDRQLHRSYRQFYSIRRWLWRRVTPAGALVLWAMVAAGSFTDVQNTMSHQMVGFLGALFLLSMLWALGRRPRLAAVRTLPSNASVGAPVRLRVRLRNLTPRWQRGMAYLEGFPDPRPTVEEFASIEEPGERRRNWFDRRYRFYRWQWLCDRNTRLQTDPQTVPDLPPGGQVEIVAELIPRRRGRLVLLGAEVSRTDPFGLFRRVLRVEDQPDSLVVFPRRLPLPPIPLPGVTRRLQSGGVALAGSVGDSEEFVSVRDYRPGDPLRKIHWAGWARTQRPVVKEFQEEYFVRHALVLDTFGGGPEADAFEQAVSLAASFACTIDRQDSLLDLMFVGARAYVFTAGRGLAHSTQLLEILASVDLQPNGDPQALEELVFRHLGRLSGCVLILLRWDPPRQELLRRLEGRRVPTLTFIVHPTPCPRRDHAPAQRPLDRVRTRRGDSRVPAAPPGSARPPLNRPGARKKRPGPQGDPGRFAMRCGPASGLRTPRCGGTPASRPYCSGRRITTKPTKDLKKMPVARSLESATATLMNTTFAPSRLRCDPPRVLRGRRAGGRPRRDEQRRCEDAKGRLSGDLGQPHCGARQ
jgi:uncharacterized protein (DUF58 family)